MRQRTSLRGSLLEELFEGTQQEPTSAAGGGRRLLSGVEPPPALRTIRRLMAALTAVAAIALAALVVSVWQLVQDDATTLVVTREVTGPPPRARAPAASPAVAAPGTTDAARAPVRRAAVRLTLTAARGECWLEVRAGSEAGRLLYRGTLARGESRSFAGRRLWIAFGAGGHLDVRLNGRRVPSFPTGTATVVVSRRGLGSTA